MKNSKKHVQAIVVKDKDDLKKVRNSILSPDEKKKQRAVETIRNTFSKIGIK